MTYETILYEVADRIATITFNRPHRYNAINEQMAKELTDAYGRAERAGRHLVGARHRRCAQRRCRRSPRQP